MKKLLLIGIALVCVMALSACNGGGIGGSENETDATVIAIEGDGMSIDMDADSARIILGAYTKEELGLAKELDEYDVFVSGTKYEGSVGVKVEAFDPEADDEAPATGVYMIVDGKCYVFDAKQNKYVPVIGAPVSQNTTDTVASVTDGDGNVQETQTAETTTPIPDDPEITFQYHKGNNAALQEKFAAYDITALGLANRLTEYVFVITERTGFTSDGIKVNVVNLYTKSGEDTGIQFGISESADYYYDKDAGTYVALTTAQ